MALLMVIIHTGLFLGMLLLHFRCYFHRIHIHSHFSSRLYWILGPFQLSTHVCLDFICMKGYIWINFDVLGKTFVILRVSGQNINGKHYSNTCVVSLFFSGLYGLEVMWCSYLLFLHYTPSFLPFLISCFIIILCVIFCQCLSRIMFVYLVN